MIFVTVYYILSATNNLHKSKSLQIYMYFILTNFGVCKKNNRINMYHVLCVWYVPLTCVAARADRRLPFRTHLPEYCPGTGNRSVGGTDTGWSSTNTHTKKDKTSACKAKKQCQLLVLHMNFLWKGHSHELPVTVNFLIEITSHEFHLKFSHMNFTWKHLCR